MSRVIDAVLRLRDEFTKPMEKSLDLMTQASKQGERTRKSIAKFGKGVESAGKTLTTALTLPIVGLGAASYKNFESVDKSLKLVQATMGDSKYATADLEEALKSAAVNSIYSMDDAASATVNFARQGWDAAQTANMLAPSMALAAGTATDLDSVTSGLGNTLKAFDADASEATKYVDMFAVAQAQANTDVQSLFDSMAIAGPIAKTVGWDFEDVATLIGVFGDNSISASEGATALKTGLSRLSGDNKKVKEAMKALGISLYDDEGRMKSMVDVMDTLQHAFSGLTQEEQMNYATKLFGANQMSKWLALINGPGLEGLTEMRDNISGASGQAQAAADAMVTPLEKLASTFDVFKYTVGDTIAGAVVPMIEKATELADKFRQLSPEEQQHIVKMALMAAAIGPVLIMFGKLIIFSSQVFGAISRLRGAIAGIKKATDIAKMGIGALTSPMALAVVAVAALIAIIAIVVTHFDQFKEAAGRAMQAIQPHIANLQTSFAEFSAVVGPIITTLSDLIGVMLVGAFEALMVGAGPVIDGIALIFSGLGDTISGVIGLVVSLINGDWKGAIDNMKKIVEGPTKVIAGAFEAISGAVNGVASALGGAIQKFKEFTGAAKIPKIKGGAGLEDGNATGTPHWEGGWSWVGEKGPELIHMPKGTEVLPHEASLNYAAQTASTLAGSAPAASSAPAAAPGMTISIPKLADQIIVREDADITKIGRALAQQVVQAVQNRGGWSFATDMG